MKIKDYLHEYGIPFTEELTPSDYKIDSPLLREAVLYKTVLRCEVDDKALADLKRLIPSNNCTLSYTAETNIPNRKNKRKRIQKKWNKKYGFKLKTVRMDGMKMRSKTDGDVCEFEAVKDINER